MISITYSIFLVCCMGSEAKNPHRTLPIAVFGTIITVTILSCLSTLSLVGMQSYLDISPTSGFAAAFESNGLFWASQVVSIGEIITLPLVVLVSFLTQPRLLYAMAHDGLMPKVFGEIDKNGNLTKGILISGTLMILIAIFVPFSYLNSMISAGVLLSFNLSNSALIIIRRGSTTSGDKWHPLTWYLLLFHAIAIVLAFFLANVIDASQHAIETTDIIVSGVLLFLELLLAIFIYFKFPENPDPDALTQYRVSWVPFLPLIGIIINYMLVAQLDPEGIIIIVAYFAAASLYYFIFCMNRQFKVALSRCESNNNSIDDTIVQHDENDGSMNIKNSKDNSNNNIEVPVALENDSEVWENTNTNTNSVTKTATATDMNMNVLNPISTSQEAALEVAANNNNNNMA